MYNIQNKMSDRQKARSVGSILLSKEHKFKKKISWEKVAFARLPAQVCQFRALTHFA